MKSCLEGDREEERKGMGEGRENRRETKNKEKMMEGEAGKEHRQ